MAASGIFLFYLDSDALQAVATEVYPKDEREALSELRVAIHSRDLDLCDSYVLRRELLLDKNLRRRPAKRRVLDLASEYVAFEPELTLLRAAFRRARREAGVGVGLQDLAHLACAAHAGAVLLTLDRGLLHAAAYLRRQREFAKLVTACLPSQRTAVESDD